MDVGKQPEFAKGSYFISKNSGYGHHDHSHVSIEPGSISTDHTHSRGQIPHHKITTISISK